MLEGPQEGGRRRLGRGSDSWQTGQEPGAGVAAGQAVRDRHWPAGTGPGGHSGPAKPSRPSCCSEAGPDACTPLPQHRPGSGRTPSVSLR